METTLDTWLRIFAEEAQSGSAHGLPRYTDTGHGPNVALRKGTRPEWLCCLQSIRFTEKSISRHIHCNSNSTKSLFSENSPMTVQFEISQNHSKPNPSNKNTKDGVSCPKNGAPFLHMSCKLIKPIPGKNSSNDRSRVVEHYWSTVQLVSHGPSMHQGGAMVGAAGNGDLMVMWWFE